VLDDPAVVLRQPPPRPWRLSARLLVVHDARLLMMRAFDPADPRAGEWWEMPGGGVEVGEDTAAAAVRETAEETGYVVPLGCVGEECWRGETTYTWLGRRHWAEMVLHVARVAVPLQRRPRACSPEESASFLEVAWLPIEDVLAGQGRYFPVTLPLDLPRLLAGERIDAGFTAWS
jgi:8-oxo-dGTP pyrophosphatase MutT (NUDIX family)